jgi:23S rRNA (cytidine1920-2'-O)/16S rRNA (cytidine1409-2'-O)-methyltransferase
MAARRRLDAELVRRGLADSRTQARVLIEQGHVVVGGTTATKPATMVDPAVAVVVTQSSEQAYASRGGHKLAGALDRLSVPVEDRHALDAGAAHGGFTDVLLRRRAARVVAVDVAYGQLDWRLREDPRVVVLERTNVRLLQPQDVPPPAPQLVVADLSFISLSLVLPALRGVAAQEADFLLMVKPQFEAGRDAVGRGGVVRDPSAWRNAVNGVVTTADGLGLGLAGACVSPLPGPSGNIEFFVWLRQGADGDTAAILSAAVSEGEHLRDPSG